MKKLSLFMAIILFLAAFSACVVEETQESVETEGIFSSEAMLEESSDQVEESSESYKPNEPDENKILTVEEMTELDAIISIEKNEKYSNRDAVVYDLKYVSDGLKLNAQIALPANYAERSYPTVIYFPEVTYDHSFLVSNFAKRGLNVIRVSSRGVHGNEGTKDLCGKDFADAETVLSICKATDFLSRGRIAVIGAGEGSARALKLAAEYPDDVIGCSVINVLSDLESICELRGEGLTEYFERVIGGTIEELPDEYKKRSAVHFADKIETPVLIFAYKDTPELPRQQAEILKDAIDKSGGECTIYDIDEVYSDFNGKAFFKLIPWVIGLAEER